MAAQQPTYQAYTVVKREGQDDFWLNIGAAFMHRMAMASTSCCKRCRSTANSFCVRRKRRTTSRHNRRHVRTRAAITIATAGKINNGSLNFPLASTLRCNSAPPLTCAGLSSHLLVLCCAEKVVRFRTKADKSRFWPEMVCRRLTQNGHRDCGRIFAVMSDAN